MKSHRQEKEYYLDRNLDIFQRHQGGESIERLAEEYKLSPITIRKIVNAKGILQSYSSNYFLPDNDLELYYTAQPKQCNPRIDG